MATNYPPFRAVLMGLVFLSASCSQTTYVDTNDWRRDAGGLNPFDRVVEYHVDLGLLAARPSCIAIGSVKVPDSVPSGQRLMEVTRFAFVSRAQAALPDTTIINIDSDPGTALLEASIRGCSHILLAELIVQDNAYYLIWSRKRIGIRARLVRADNGDELWTAQHVASRSEGDLPLSPFGAIITVFRTKDFVEDKDVLPSMVDDAVRRIFVAFPLANSAGHPSL